MCTLKLEKSSIFFTILAYFFYTFYLTFQGFLRIFLRKIVKSKVLITQENQL